MNDQQPTGKATGGVGKILDLISHANDRNMSFADSFWTHDYNLGFEILFKELYQGIDENRDFVVLFSKRMEAELIYGTQLTSIQELKPTNKRYFNNDDYVSSVKNAYLKINENFGKQGEYHLQVASNIKENVIDPFNKWCKEHKKRVEFLESVISDKYKLFKIGKSNLESLQKKYFNKCRLLEEFKSHYTDEELADELKDLKFADSSPPSASSTFVDDSNDDDTVYQLGGTNYDHKALKQFLTDLLTDVKLFSHKVPILGTYSNVTTGATITQWLLDNSPQVKGNIVLAESFGQDLINNGFIRLIGSMSGGKNFINSSQFFYQWKPLAFEITSLPQHKTDENSNDQTGSNNNTNNKITNKSTHFIDYFEDMKQAIGVNAIDYNDKSQLSKLVHEVNILDHQYFTSTVELDKIRCEFEEVVMDHLTFMQKCELDRLRAIKKVTFDFISSFSNKLVSMKQLCDELLILEETVHPSNDLKFLIENYSTGKFNPQVILYDNYYNSNIKQTFGVSLNVKCRLDRKVVPILIQCILSHLDNVYPDLTNDEERINLWTQPIHLSNIHQLRFQLNSVSDQARINEILSQNDPMVITNLLKLYLMELPESLVPNTYYDLIKSIYANYPPHSKDSAINDSRINGLQNILIDLPKSHLATLDAILTHVCRLIHIIGSQNEELGKNLQITLAKELSSIILKPKFDQYVESSPSSSSSQYQTEFMVDLLDYKDTIFKELRRRNSSKGSSGTLSTSSSLHRRPSPAPAKTLSRKENIAADSKSRLESRLKKAVSKKTPAINNNITNTSNSSKSSKASTDSAHQDAENNSDLDFTTPKMNKSVVPEPPTTPTPSLKTISPSPLRRSTSPNKKKFMNLSEVANGSSPSISSSTSTSGEKLSIGKIVSSTPMKKDIVYETSNNSSPNHSTIDLTQPPAKFAPSLERRTSVKDLAQRFDSPPPVVPSKDKWLSLWIVIYLSSDIIGSNCNVQSCGTQFIQQINFCRYLISPFGRFCLNQ